MATTNPLDKFVDSNPTNPTTFRVPAFPKLAEIINQHGLQKGAMIYDEQVEEWRQKHERNITEQLKTTVTIPGGKLV